MRRIPARHIFLNLIRDLSGPGMCGTGPTGTRARLPKVKFCYFDIYILEDLRQIIYLFSDQFADFKVG